MSNTMNYQVLNSFIRLYKSTGAWEKVKNKHLYEVVNDYLEMCEVLNKQKEGSCYVNFDA